MHCVYTYINFNVSKLSIYVSFLWPLLDLFKKKKKLFYKSVVSEVVCLKKVMQIEGEKTPATVDVSGKSLFRKV